uniref:RNA-dependent RNA polymerase n=1 Tax=Riboviria sp. TaxID=2585031 RepID=A0A514D6N6_9VIRU|nr:MAG: RNA-dependent RNA polymerase [Riboviria sp.]
MTTLVGHCVGETTDLPIRQEADIDTSEVKCCLDSRRVMQTAIPCPAPGTWVPAVHAKCHHNEVAALLKRSLAPTPTPVPGQEGPVLAVFRTLRRVAGRYRGQRWGYLETAQSYSGAMCRRYLEAQSSLMLDGPIRSSDYKLRAFVKAEKVKPWSVSKPRMIYPRSPRYNLVLASWLKPFEHWLWGNLKSRAFSGVGNSRVVAKGLNPVQRANLIVRKMSQLSDCFGRTDCGVKFSREGGRASGDFNTGMGNSLIMLAVVVGTLSRQGAGKWDVLVDGDNALLFLPGSDAERVYATFADTALKLSGHEMTLERPTRVVEEVRFGQSAPVRCEGGWKMVREWRKVLSHSTSSHHHLREPRFAVEHLRGVSLCETSLSHGVPILWAFTRRLLALTEGVEPRRLHSLRDYQILGVDLDRLQTQGAREPDDEARQSFHLAFGVDADGQRIIEDSFSHIDIQVVAGELKRVTDEYGLVFE